MTTMGSIYKEAQHMSPMSIRLCFFQIVSINIMYGYNPLAVYMLCENNMLLTFLRVSITHMIV